MLDETLTPPTKTTFNWKRIVAILLSLLFAITLYSFALLIWEAYRLLSIDANYEVWEIAPETRWFFRLVLAYISIISAQSFLIAFALDTPRKTKSRRHFHNKIIVNDQRNLNWSFLYWFFKFSIILLGIFISVSIFASEQTLVYPIYKFAFVLLILTLFLHPWTGILRKYKRKAWRWMGTSALTITSLAFALSLFDPVPHKELTQAIHAKNFRKNYSIELPQIKQSVTKNGYDLNGYQIDFHLMRKPSDSSILIGIQDTIYRIDQLHQMYNSLPSNAYASYAHKLYADGDIKMNTINKVCKAIYRHNYKNHMYFAYQDANQNHLPYSHYQNAYLLSNVFNGQEGELNQSRLDKELRESNNICVLDILIRNKETIVLNDSSIRIDELTQYFINHYRKKSTFAFNLIYTPDTKYTYYLQTRIALDQGISKLRNSYCQKHYGLDYYDAIYSDTIDTRKVKRRYRYAIFHEQYNVSGS